MKFFKLIAVFLVSLMAQSSLSIAASSEQVALDAFNHLTINYVFLREGIDPQSLKEEVLSNVNFALLPEEVVATYKKFTQLADVVTQKREEIFYYGEQAQVAGDRLKKEKDAEALSKLASLAVDIASPGVGGLFRVLSSGSSTPSSVNLAGAERQKLQAALRSELSNFEFDLGVSKSRLANKYGFVNRDFILTKDVDEYLEVGSKKVGDPQKIALHKRLLEKSPNLYFAAYEVGLYGAKSGDKGITKKYLQMAASSVPVILYRSELRANSNAYLGAAWSDDLGKAAYFFDKALLENPSNLIALVGKTASLMKQKSHGEARENIEQAIELYPRNPWIRYIYASVLASTDAAKQDVLRELSLALDFGYTDISRIAEDEIFSGVANSSEFKSLFSPKVEYGIKWRKLHKDELQLTNTSAFDMTNVSVYVAFAQYDGRGYFRAHNDPRLLFDRFLKKQMITVPIIESTKRKLAVVKVTVESDQGGYSFEIENKNGSLTANNFKRLDQSK